MIKTFELTPKEFSAARVLVQSCLDAMGGQRPADLEKDEFTWVDLKDLTRSGYSRHEAAGLMSALAAKGFISLYEPNQWIVQTSGWRWMDTVWR